MKNNYELLVEALSAFPRFAAKLAEGGIYYLDPKGRIMFVKDGVAERELSPDDENLAEILEQVKSETTVPAIDEAVRKVQQLFEITDEMPVISLKDDNPEMGTQVGRIMVGAEKSSGVTVVTLSGYGGASINVLTMISDAEENVNPQFVADLTAFAYSIMQVADIISPRDFCKPSIPEIYDDGETSDPTHFSPQRRAEA